MGFLYHFVTLNEEEQAHRRKLLDGYGQFAQLSILLLPLIYQLSLGIRLLGGRLRNFRSQHVSKERSSPVVARFKEPLPSQSKTSNFLARIRWILNGEIVPGWGTWQEWLVAALWAAWLLVLAIRDTGDDYLHVTKRFAIVAASQLPLHYLLAAKSWSPIQYLTRMSHEELNPYHRLLGRIIVTFFSLHASMYLNFFIQSNLLLKRIRDWDVILGLTAITTSLVLFTSALRKIRDVNYRIFFYLHVILSLALLPILYLHVSHLRVYILEAAAIYALLIFQRNFSQTSTDATIKLIPSTNLLSITIPLTKSLASKSYKPGQHIYLGFPSLLQKLRINPFSITNANPLQDQKIHLVARSLLGTTATLATLATKPQPIPLTIEGPYGSAAYFPNLATYDSVLLIAGGVGATFTLPLFCDLLQRRIATTGDSGPKVRFVWSVKTVEDAMWGIEQICHCTDEAALPREVELYSTRRRRRGSPSFTPPHPPPAAASSESDEIHPEAFELHEREGLLNNSDNNENTPFSDQGVVDTQTVLKATRQKRPDLRSIVDEVFEHSGGHRVAVLVCGPSGLGAGVRKEVGRWVGKREIFWLAEEFGW